MSVDDAEEELSEDDSYRLRCDALDYALRAHDNEGTSSDIASIIATAKKIEAYLLNGGE